MNDTTTDLRDAVRDVLSPYYGALTNSAIEDITDELLPIVERGKADELRRFAGSVEDGLAVGIRNGAHELIRDQSIARKLRARADELGGGKP